MENQNDLWASTFKKRLPMLALIAPICFFIASVIRAIGIGTLPGDLNWASPQEGLIMAIGVPFFVATFIFLGQRIAERSPKTGVWVTILGVLGVAFLAFIAGFRALAAGLVNAGLDPNEINSAFESEYAAIWATPLLLYNLGQFIAWVIAGVAVIRTKLAPWWVGVTFILGVLCVITAQGLYYNLEIFWPLGNGLWMLGVWGLVKKGRK